MELIIDVVSWALLLTGAFFGLVGGIGLLRFPDFYSRMHAAGVTDTMGAGLMLAGMMVQGGFSLVTVKLILILLFMLITSPTSTHAVAKSALISGLRPLLGKAAAKRGTSR